LSMTATDATFTLWDDQTKLATLFKEVSECVRACVRACRACVLTHCLLAQGDYLAISNPKFPLAGAWKDKRTLEYGPQTIVHVLPMAPSQDLVSSSTSPYALTPTPTQFRVPKDEKVRRAPIDPTNDSTSSAHLCACVAARGTATSDTFPSQSRFKICGPTWVRRSTSTL
jgi:hypothetical protein